MKKFFALFVALVACSVFAFADGFNAPVSTFANFDCKVIAPLTWTNPTGTATPSFIDEIIAGQTRILPTPMPFTFTLNGEGDYAVTINHYGPTSTTGQTNVTIDGDWSAAPSNLTGGHATMTFTAKGITSKSLDDHGDYLFTISVDAVYTSL